jgi:putative ABC transport system substrate-binding protein
MIGFLSSVRGPSSQLPDAFREGLGEGGYVEGRNVKIEFRYAEGQYDRLQALAADLVRRQATVIAATGGLVSAMAAKATTTTIPILFVAGFDPVKLGLVTSLNRPGGNTTGVSVYTSELALKRLELLRELVPKPETVALMVNAGSYGNQFEQEHLQAATTSLGLRLLVLEASAETDFERVFAHAAEEKVGALLVSADPFFTSRRAKIIALAARYRLPTVYPWRSYAVAGGLLSYGPPITWAYRQVGIYASRILKGAAPGDLPVQLPTTFELIINLKTAKALGLTVSRLLNARADLLIE